MLIGLQVTGVTMAEYMKLYGCFPPVPGDL